MTWNRADLERLKKEGKIRGFDLPESEARTEMAKIVTKHFKKRSKEKDWISWNLLYWSGLHQFKLMEEFRFHEKRKWRFDWYLERDELKIGIEYNGIMSEKSRHTSITGYSEDLNKINAAMALGIRVMQFSPLTYKNLINQLNQLLN